MRIISKNKDYYDSIQSYGLDSSVVFVREEKELTVDETFDYFGVNSIQTRDPVGEILESLAAGELPQKRNRFGRVRFKSNSVSANFFVVGFCGQFFPCVKIYHDNSHVDKGKKDLVFYKGDDLEIFEDFNNSLRSVNRLSKREIESLKVKIKLFLNINFKESNDIFFQFKSPIVVFNITDYYSINKGHSPMVLVNTSLADYKFYRVKDPFTAYQDIGQFISGVLGDQENPMVDISDGDMRDAKGFDKWSFKRRPSKR